MRHHGWFYWVCLIGFIGWTAYKLPGAFLYLLGIAVVCVAILLVFDIRDPNGRSIRDYFRGLRWSGAGNQTLGDADHMDGISFERWCGSLLYKVGFTDIQYTKASGDQGVDILAVYHGERYAIQCKRAQGAVGTSAVQEVVSGRAVYGCQRCAVMTNSTFTNGAKQAALANHVQLIDRNVLIQWIQRAGDDHGLADTNDPGRARAAQEQMERGREDAEWQDLFDFLSATEDDD